MSQVDNYKTSAPQAEDDDEFRFNDASTHESHLRQNSEAEALYARGK